MNLLTGASLLALAKSIYITPCLAASHSRGTKPPCWDANIALGQAQQKAYLNGNFLCLSCPSATFASQHGGFVPLEWKAAKGLSLIKSSGSRIHGALIVHNDEGEGKPILHKFDMKTFCFNLHYNPLLSALSKGNKMWFPSSSRFVCNFSTIVTPKKALFHIIYFSPRGSGDRI